MKVFTYLLVALLLGTVPAAAQQKSTVQQESTTVRENTAVIGTAEGEERVSTSDIRSIRFDGSVVTVSRPWGDQTYDGTLRSLTFQRPLPGTLRLTVSATLDNSSGINGGDNNNGTNARRRALSPDDSGTSLRSTWEEGDKVYVYTDAMGTTAIGTLTPQSFGTATTSLVGDIDGSQLTNGQTLYLSTVERPHGFAAQTGTLSDLFYATATASVTVKGANATMSSAVFQNPQSITAFTLKDGYGNALQIAKLVISDGDDEDITVTPPTAASTLYVALPATAAQTVFTFSATTADGQERKGTKKASVQEGKYYTANVTVRLAPTYTAPTARTLVYTGKAQNLVTAGSSKDGKFTYSTSEDGEYTVARPQGTDAGSYSVWYKLKGDADHYDIAATEVTGVSIAKAEATLNVTDIGFGGTTKPKTMIIESNGGAVSAAVTGGRGCKVTVRTRNTITITRTTTKAFKATVSVRTARTANYKETVKSITVSGTTVYPVESFKAGSYQCAKVFTGDGVGYYIMCTDQSTPMNWANACKASVTVDGKTFTCGSKADWETIIAVCGDTGWNGVNATCRKVTGWTAMTGNYWSGTENSNSTGRAWNFDATGWLDGDKVLNKRVRLISRFSYKKGDVESVTMGSYQCAKVYTSPMNGYYIVCSDYSTSANWSTACGINVSQGGKTFSCGSKAAWEAIMSACGGTGYDSINSKCGGVAGWSNMTGGYWTNTGISGGTASYFGNNSWNKQYTNSGIYRVRLVSAF